MTEVIKHGLWRPLAVVLVSVVLLTACETAEPKVTTYIEVQRADTIHEYGEPKFSVAPGDVLKVIRSKTCRFGYGECWEVLNVKTGETGYVIAEKMKKWHRVYTDGQSFADTSNNDSAGSGIVEGNPGSLIDCTVREGLLPDIAAMKVGDGADKGIIIGPTGWKVDLIRVAPGKTRFEVRRHDGSVDPELTRKVGKALRSCAAIKPQPFGARTRMFCFVGEQGRRFSIYVENNNFDDRTCRASCSYTDQGQDGVLACSGTIPARAKRMVFCTKYGRHSKFVFTGKSTMACE